MVFIFDIGNVLVEFQPVAFLEKLYAEPALVAKLNEIIFRSEEWLMMDAGKISHEEARAVFCAREPEYQDSIRYTMQRMPEMLTPMLETIRLLPEIKNAGHKLYYLSNYHHELRDFIVSQYRFFDLFEGGVFSCDVHQNKPDASIYHSLLRKYSLDPAECLFFDDVAANVKAADQVGIRGVLFTGVDCVKPHI